MKILWTTCLLFALLPAVTSLKCYQCGQYPGFPSCLYPKVVECAENEDSCLNEFSIAYTKDERIMGDYTKTCVDSKSYFNGSYIVTTVIINVIGTTELCQRDLCNNKEHHFRRSDVEENGWKCPACITLGSDHCKAQNMISCRGDETKCLYISGMTEGSEGVENYFALQGCVTPNLCNIRKGELEMFGGMITNIKRLKCTNAKMSLSVVEGYARAPHHLKNLPFIGMKQRSQGPGN